MSTSLRVIHCGTGVAGTQALRAILQHPQLELAGLLVHGEAAEGRRAGELARVTSSCTVLGTRDFSAIVATPADIVCYMLLLPDVERIATLLACGKNVVTTAGLMWPGWHDQAVRARLEEACHLGHSSFYVTGINPGFVDEILPLTVSALTQDIRRLHIREYANCAKYPAPHILSVMGFGRSSEDIVAGRLPDLAVMREFFAQSVAALAHGLGCVIDDIQESREFAFAPRSYAIAAGPIAKGTIAGQRWRWRGLRGGVERIVQETYWITGPGLGETWPDPADYEDDTQWQLTFEGRPSLRCTFEPRHSFTAEAVKIAQQTDYNPSGLATAMAAVNSFAAVCAARPGLLASGDLALPHCRQYALGARHA